jgi:AcrR family transcriptional regulator
MFGNGRVRLRNKVDRRVERTRQLLRDALVSLIREKGFAALSVQEIIDRANVGRATFYAHFDNKEDLLMAGLDGVRSTLKDLQRQALARGGRPEERLFAFSHELFAHTDGHRDLFRAMVRDRSVGLLQQVFHKMIVDLVRDDVKAMLPPARGDSMPSEAVVQFVAGGLYGLLLWWLEARVRPGVKEVNAILRRLAIPAVTAPAG